MCDLFNFLVVKRSFCENEKILFYWSTPSSSLVTFFLFFINTQNIVIVVSYLTCYVTFSSSSSCVLGKCTFAGICVKFEKQMSKYSTQKSAKNSLKIVTDWKSCFERVKSFRLEFLRRENWTVCARTRDVVREKGLHHQRCFPFFLSYYSSIYILFFIPWALSNSSSKQASKKIRNKEWIQRNLEKKREMKKKKEM